MRKEDRKKFIELANKRVQKALGAIKLIGNLSNRSNYSYTDSDAVKIFKALQDELNACRKRFDLAAKKKETSSFKLEE